MDRICQICASVEQFLSHKCRDETPIIIQSERSHFYNKMYSESLLHFKIDSTQIYLEIAGKSGIQSAACQSEWKKKCIHKKVPRLLLSDFILKTLISLYEFMMPDEGGQRSRVSGIFHNKNSYCPQQFLLILVQR